MSPEQSTTNSSHDLTSSKHRSRVWCLDMFLRTAPALVWRPPTMPMGPIPAADPTPTMVPYHSHGTAPLSSYRGMPPTSASLGRGEPPIPPPSQPPAGPASRSPLALNRAPPAHMQSLQMQAPPVHGPFPRATSTSPPPWHQARGHQTLELWGLGGRPYHWLLSPRLTDQTRRPSHSQKISKRRRYYRWARVCARGR